VDITVHFCGPSVKQLRRAWQEAVPRGPVRLIRHSSALWEGGAGRASAPTAEHVGISRSTVDRWVQAFRVQRGDSLRYGAAPGRPGKLCPPEGALEGPAGGQAAGGGLSAGRREQLAPPRPELPCVRPALQRALGLGRAAHPGLLLPKGALRVRPPGRGTPPCLAAGAVARAGAPGSAARGAAPLWRRFGAEASCAPGPRGRAPPPGRRVGSSRSS
jgi:hypothetical protein